MTERWYEVLNTQGDTVLHHNKPVLFRHASLKSAFERTWYSDEEVYEMPGNSSFTNGWLEKKEVYLVNTDGLASKLLFAYVLVQ